MVVSLSFLFLLTFSIFFAILAEVEWENTETTNVLWNACSMRNTKLLKQIVEAEPDAAFARSADGRGALFWAYEFGDTEAIAFLEKLGVDPNEEDAFGKTPKQLGIENEEENKHRSFPNFNAVPQDDKDADEEEDEDEDEGEDDDGVEDDGL